MDLNIQMKTKIIVLKNNAVSQTVSQDCIAQAKKFGISAEVFDAINGLDYQRHLENLGIRPLKKFKKNRPGVYGCFLSHYYLWKQCAESNKPYMILEHDGFLIQPLPEDILDHFDDLLKLESENPYSKGYQRRLIATQNDPLCYQNVEPCGDQNNGAGWYSVGAYAYIIKPPGAKKLIDWIQQHGFLPADQQLGSDIVSIYECRPSLARLHEFYSKDGNIKSMSTTMNPELL
jgi:GR25 family glycosyltransferase involved in LPS biosynthesis